NSRYHVDHYTGHSRGYVATRKVQSYKERQIGYSKHDELGTKGLQEFVKDHPRAAASFSRNALRIESNYTSHKRTRDAFRIATNNIGSIINSVANPNYHVFEKIVKKGQQLDLFSDLYDGMSLPEIRNHIGYKGIFQRFDNDLSLVEQWIKNTFDRGKHYHYYKIVRQAYSDLNRAELQETHKYIDEILLKLKAA
ncbi:unnamed protein product, partial [marine sediment metagenome]